MSFVAVAVGAGAVISAGVGVYAADQSSNAAKDAANKQTQAASSAAELQYKAAHESNDLQKSIYDQQRADQEPWRQAGVTALSGLGNPDFQRDFASSDFQKDPGYDFRMQEGQKALERSAASRGGLQSGGTLKALSRYGQDYASNEYQNAYTRFNSDRDRRFNRLSSLAGVGQTANSQMGAAGSNYANQVGATGQNYATQAGGYLTGAANAQGAAGIAQANAWGGAANGVASAANNGINNWMSYTLANKYMGGK